MKALILFAALSFAGSTVLACDEHAAHKAENTTSGTTSGASSDASQSAKLVAANATTKTTTTVTTTTDGKAADTTVADVSAEPTAEESQEAKNKFQKKMEAELNDIEKEIDELSAKAKTSTAEARKKVEAKLVTLNARKDAIETDLKKAAKSSGRAWSRVKSGLEKAVSELKSAYNEAKEEFKAQPQETGAAKK